MLRRASNDPINGVCERVSAAICLLAGAGGQELLNGLLAVLKWRWETAEDLLSTPGHLWHTGPCSMLLLFWLGGSAALRTHEASECLNFFRHSSLAVHNI